MLAKIVSIPGLSEFIAKELEEKERQDEWPINEGELKTKIEDETERHQIPLPEGQDEKRRWSKVVYIAASLIEGFSYGNLLTTKDYYPSANNR